jgi:hypothetical protein
MRETFIRFDFSIHGLFDSQKSNVNKSSGDAQHPSHRQFDCFIDESESETKSGTNEVSTDGST